MVDGLIAYFEASRLHLDHVLSRGHHCRRHLKLHSNRHISNRPLISKPFMAVERSRRMGRKTVTCGVKRFRNILDLSVLEMNLFYSVGYCLIVHQNGELTGML